VTRVLHVEDQPPMRLLVRLNFEWEGIEVVEAVDGPSGVRAAVEHRPDVLLLGIHMRGFNGIEVAQHVRADAATHAIPIVFIAARREFCDCVRELELDDVGAVHAPFNPVELWPFVERVLESARKHEPSAPEDLEPLWALRRIATTPDDAAVPGLVARWREERQSG
jgi:DNA-binding response OmpR family regulator